MNNQASNQSLDLSSFGTKVSDNAQPVSGSQALDLSAYGTPVDASAPDPDVADASDRGFIDRRLDDAQRGFNRAMQGIDIQDLDRRSTTAGYLDQIDAGTYAEPVERWERLSEDPRAKQYRLAGPEERAQIRQTLRGAMDEDITDLVSAEQNISQLPQSDEARRFGEAEDFGSAWDALADAPVEVISSLATESLGQQSPYLPLMAIHPALGAGAGSYITEKGADIVNSLREAGVDFSSEESIRDGLSNPEQMAAFRQHAARRGLAVGLVDAISGGLAGKYAAGATTTLSRIGRGAVEDLVMQPALGATGEAIGSIAAGDEISGKELLAEAAGEIGPGAVETTVGTIQNVRRREAGSEQDIPDDTPSDEVSGEPLMLAGPQQASAALPAPATVYGEDFTMSEPGPAATQSAEAEQLPAPDQYGRLYGEGFVAGEELLPPAPGPNYVAMVDRNGRQTGWFNPETAHAVGKDLGAFETARRQGPSIDDLMADGRSADEIRAELVEKSRQERATADVGSVVRIKVPGKRAAEQVRVVGFTQDAAVVETRDGQKIALADDQISKPEQLSLDLSTEQPRSAVADDIQNNRLVAEIEQAAQQAQTPASEAQAEAGNYRKGHIKIGGLDIAIENPRGSTRSGTDADGKSWSVDMPAHYGYIKRTEGADGDHVDVYVGPEPDSEDVYVIDQIDHKTGKFDEHKVLMGYPSSGQAQADYRRAFNDGRGVLRMGAVTPMSLADFKTWIKEGDTKKPLAYQEPSNNVTRSSPKAENKAQASEKSKEDNVTGSEKSGERFRMATDKVSPKRTQLEDAVIAEIKRLAPDVKVEIRANGKTLIGGKKTDAGYIPLDDLIWTAMDAADPTHAGRHEVVHHLRATGRLTEAEWSILQRKAKSTWRKEYRVEDYREQYSGDADIETVLDEEAVAEAFADWMEGGSDAKGGVARIFRKIKQFFDRIASVVRGQGYQSAEDVFRSIDEGEVGKRATNDLEKMKQQRSEYFAMSGLRKKSGSAAAKPKQKASPLSAAQEAAIKRTMANIEDEQPVAVRVRETLADAVDYIKHGAVQHIFDQFDSIKRYEKATYGQLKRASMSAYKMARLTTNLSSTMAAVLRHGPLEYKNGAFQVRKGFDGGFEAIFADLSDRGLLKAWKGWAVANRAARLAREGRENNMTAQDIALLKDLDKQYPEFRDVMKRWTAFNKAMLDMAEQTGLLDPDARALFEHDDYVPFYRAIDDTPTGPFRKKGLANQRNGINRLKGGEAEVNDLIDNMVRNMTQLVDASMKNVAAKRVMRTLKTAGLDDGSVIMKVPHDAVPVHVTPEEAAQALENIGVQVQGMSKQQHDQWLKLFTLRPPKDPDVVSVMVGGKPQYFRVNDPLLLASMTSLGTDRVHWLVSILGYPKRWLTTGVTATPGFMLRNFIRDSLHGWVVSGEKFRPGIDGFKGAIRSYREDTALVNIMAAGGGSGGFFRTQSRDVAKMLSSVHGKNAIIDSPKKAWEWWKRVGQATENANRLAIYDSVLKDTGDVAEAAYQALDIMDFSMRGDSAVIRFLIGTIPFLNARMQGLYRLGRGMKQNPKAFVLRGGLITAATMLLYSLNADDDRYDELPEWEKDAYYHIFLDRIFPEDALKAAGIPFDEFHIRLPKPFEVGALFSTIPERATRLAQGKDDLSRYGERMWSMLRDTFAVDLPQFVKPLAEQWANEVTFTGSPIIPERMQDLEPEAQYDARTSELAKQIGDAMPDFMGDAKSPKRIEAAVRAFFGSYGVYVMGIADEILDPVVGNPVEPDLRGDQLPEIGSFIRQQPYRSTRFVSEFYDLKREIEAVAKTYKQYRSQGQIDDAKDIAKDGGNKKIAMAGWMRSKAKQMSGINKQIRSVEESRSLTSAQKRKQIDRLSEQRNELAEQVVKALNKAGIK